ncbi:hypothetical Protein YC6258_04527 [Gynuella sunshinyii YC6258]|uniref:Uncharacterized protein n=1 Tax=Gynuella sunshinyii YC6258 TaxID=1445510 RepID=A0A0C5W1K5_9GAMM|nr:hypothetical Protein YC6258_04527 [Gynuella sunshinyii YC6258]
MVYQSRHIGLLLTKTKSNKATVWKPGKRVAGEIWLYQ